MEKSSYIFVGVDPQNDFIDGSLAVAEAEQIIEPINSIADEIRKHDGTVVFSPETGTPKKHHILTNGQFTAWSTPEELIFTKT